MEYPCLAAMLTRPAGRRAEGLLPKFNGISRPADSKQPPLRYQRSIRTVIPTKQ
jgi:hypothetical protein